jgi:hypothetical protein
MGRKLLLQSALATGLLAGALVGCHKNAIQRKEPPDPLLVTKKPVEGRPRPAETTTAWNEPTPPPVPNREPLPISAQQAPVVPAGPPLAGNQRTADRRP